MGPEQGERPGTETGATQSNSVADLELALSISQPRRAVRFDSRRMLARRKIVRELDEYFGIFPYPDVSVVYAVAPSREAALDE
jgi:hypothetical protein